MQHSIKVLKNDTIIEKSHVFCLMEWYINHPNRGYYGVSAIVSMPITYGVSAAQYMPIQRIVNKCAHGKLNVNISGSSGEEMLIAIPVHLNYSM